VRFSLKDFQIDAADALIAALGDARPAAAKGRPQAVVLSSPTGSGKTVVVTEMIERIMFGHDGSTADPRAVFLWLSDSPELNEQSRKKIVEASDEIPPHRLVTIENEFDQEFLAAGHVYFLNTQKLGAKALLTQPGDKRTWTIWRTIEATAKTVPDSFYLIIDEAHRGMRDADKAPATQTKNENARLTIVQKFIKGDATLGLSPVPLIVGISATPERFNKVLEGTPRAIHPVTVPSEDVRDSGLIKDRIKLDIADKGDEADWSLLQHAAERVFRYTQEWADYCKVNGITPLVEPVLVVQVENGTDDVPTRTDLATCVQVLQRVYGAFQPGALAHCFDTEGDVPAGQQTLRKVDASKIQDDRMLRVVFFKTALTTGWDCPRAEVMMSFRKATDHTMIAQLVGRMVRTPLARRIESNEFLNSVSLSLPHYDEAGVNAIIDRLQNPETGAPVEVENDLELAVYHRSPGKEDLFDAFAKLPTYVVHRPRRMAETARLVKLGRMLNMDGANHEAWAGAKRFVIDRLLEQRDRLRRDPSFRARVEGSAKVPVREFVIEYGRWREGIESTSYLIDATPENIYDLFTRCATILGEGLHETYANRAEYRGNIDAARLELFCILQDEKAPKLIQEACEREFERLWQEHKEDVVLMRAPRQEDYKNLRRRGGTVVAESIAPVVKIEVRRESPLWNDHLFVDDKGKFGWDAGAWERAVLKVEAARPGFAGFLRNIPRKRWAISIPYGSTEDKALYPDVLIFRRVKTQVHTDILEPHGDYLADALEKAQGLAKYAAKHGDGVGRIEMIRIVKDRIERLDLQDDKVRRKVLMATNAEQLKDLYAQFG